MRATPARKGGAGCRLNPPFQRPSLPRPALPGRSQAAREADRGPAGCAGSPRGPGRKRGSRFSRAGAGRLAEDHDGRRRPLLLLLLLGRSAGRESGAAQQGSRNGGVKGGAPPWPPGFSDALPASPGEWFLPRKQACSVAAMKCTGSSESEKCAFVLDQALAREAKIWKVPIFQDFRLKGTDIPPIYYEKAVLWIGELSSLFQFCSGTFALATSILNRLLASVKAQLKYLQCIAIACLVLAAKINEEDEIIPSVKKLAVQSGCKCSPAEILRMERTVLDKLHWDLYTATSMDFLNIVSTKHSPPKIK
uniref:cyclin-I2 n=1 Tax=Euleptes europaea TaxID=460621 RepID=UPI002541392B|nr:cyclin-I2 [Euleptes europaea]